MHRRKYLASLWPYLLLTAIVAILFWRNYAPGTWLTGWDNLHPEFDFQTNITQRSLFSVWQEYQGLGLHAGNAHAADLLRQLGLWALSFLLAPSLLRYSYHFLALLVGAIGMYELLRRYGAPAGLIGSLVYLLNLGTMQNFHVPYEAFSHFYASLPWLVLTLTAYLERPTKKNGVLFLIANMLATPMSYIPTIFIVYLLVVGMILTGFLLRRGRVGVAVAIVSMVLAVNAFWLLPFLSFVSRGTGFVAEVKINRMFTREAFLRNQAFGDMGSVAILKGFLFDTTDLVDATSGHDFLMRPWINHLANPWARGILVGLFIVTILGYLVAIAQKRPYAGSFGAILVMSLFMLVNDNPPTGWLFSWLEDHLPLFGQVLRFPYTKFVVVTSATYAVGVAYFFSWILPLIPRAGGVLTIMSVGAALVWATWPSFTGNFIYARMRENIPSEYFELFTFFQSQDPAGRIANLPQPTFWGWTAYDWGYRGSGFPWYGIPQPILDRAFDVWNPANERYYEDISRSIYISTDPSDLQKVLETYDITYFWIDGRVIVPDKPNLMATADLVTRIEKIPGIYKVFAVGKQTVYRYEPNAAGAYLRLAYGGDPQRSVFGPVVNGRIDGTEITKTESGVRLMTTLPAGTIHVPPIGGTQGQTLVRVRREAKTITVEPILPTMLANGTPLGLQNSADAVTIPIRADPDDLVQIGDTILPPDTTRTQLVETTSDVAVYADVPERRVSLDGIGDAPLANCWDRTIGTSLYRKTDEPDGSFTLGGTQSRPCVYAPISALAPQLAASNVTTAIVEISFQYRSTTGSSPSVCLTKDGETGCFYRSPEPTSPSDGTWQEARYLVPIAHYPLANTWFKLELDAAGAQDLKEMSYRGVRLALYIPTTRQTVPLLSHEPGQDLVFPGGELTVIVPDERTVPLLPAEVTHEGKNCFALGKGSFDRAVIADPEEGAVVEYRATDASSCDWYYFDAPALSLGGVVSYRTKNVSGRPIKTCLKVDPPGYCLYEDILFDAGSDWSTISRVSPAITTADPQFFVEFDTYAVGREHRVNRISRVDVTPVPMSWLTALRFTGQTQGNGVTLGTSGSRIPGAKRRNPVFYTVALRRNEGTLVFSQSYDPGWTAWERIPTFPFFHPLPDHVLVNNWANGWRLDSTQCTEKSAQSKLIASSSPLHYALCTVYLFFLPQLLQWLGFVLLAIPFLWVWYTKHV